MSLGDYIIMKLNADDVLKRYHEEDLPEFSGVDLISVGSRIQCVDLVIANNVHVR